MAKISQIKQYAIQFLHEIKKLSEEQIAEEVGLSVDSVASFVKTLNVEKPKNTEKKKSKSKELMIRHTNAKKINNVTIMTEAASQYNDEAVKNMSPVKINKNGVRISNL